MIKLKVNEYQNYMTVNDWINLLGKALKDNLLADDDWDFVYAAVDSYIKNGKPKNFNVISYIQNVKKFDEYAKVKKNDNGQYLQAPLYVSGTDGCDIENPEIYEYQKPFNLEESLVDQMTIDSAFDELTTINKEIMIKYHINLIKLIKRCLNFPSKYSEEFITLRNLIKELDDTQKEAVAIILSSGRAFA